MGLSCLCLNISSCFSTGNYLLIFIVLKRIYGKDEEAMNCDKKRDW